MKRTPGSGLLLFFRVDDFGPALKRARALVTLFEEEPHVNPNTHTREFSLRDPDGYYVTIVRSLRPNEGASEAAASKALAADEGARPNQQVTGETSAPSQLKRTARRRNLAPHRRGGSFAETSRSSPRCGTV